MILSYYPHANLAGACFILGLYFIIGSLLGRGYRVLPLQKDPIGKRLGVARAKLIYICLGAVLIGIAFLLKDKI